MAPGLIEVRVPKSAEHSGAEGRLHALTGVPVTDVAFPRLHRLTPAFAATVARRAVPGCALVASHPYTLPALRRAMPNAELWYDAHNVELDLKAAMLPRTAAGLPLLARTALVERACTLRATRVLVASAQDGERLRRLYRVPAARITLVPNGVDATAVVFTARASGARSPGACGCPARWRCSSAAGTSRTCSPRGGSSSSPAGSRS